jgi:hypothetical protein
MVIERSLYSYQTYFMRGRAGSRANPDIVESLEVAVPSVIGALAVYPVASYCYYMTELSFRFNLFIFYR